MNGYSKWKIVIGKSSSDKHPKRYIMKESNGHVTYHNYKEKVHRWQTKYGPYNSIKEKGGKATFYNVGKEIEIEIIERLTIEIDPRDVSGGFNF